MAKALTFQPTAEIAQQAEKGLTLRKAHRAQGGTRIGVARAKSLKNRQHLPIGTVKRMASYFARHQVDKRAANFGNDDKPSKGYVAWLLWGGDAGKKWVEHIIKELEKHQTQG